MKPTTDSIESTSSNPNRSSGGKLPQLYDTPRKIPVEVFYRIMETGDLTLLIIQSEKPMLQRLWERIRKPKDDTKRLYGVWLDLQEYYYANTNKQSFQRFKDNFKRVILLQNEITGCYAGLRLVELGENEGLDILKQFGITATEPQQIQSAINRKETKLEFAKNKLGDNDKKEAVSFYKQVASVESNLNRQLNLNEINLERWVAYLEEIKQRYEAQKKELTKNKRNGRRN